MADFCKGTPIGKCSRGNGVSAPGGLKKALNRNGQRILFIVALVMGLALIGRGVVEFLA